MTEILPRFYREQLAALDAARLDEILAESTAVVAPIGGATLAGDTRRLRGLPVIGRGIGGTSPGSDPFNEACRLDWLR